MKPQAAKYGFAHLAVGERDRLLGVRAAHEARKAKAARLACREAGTAEIFSFLPPTCHAVCSQEGDAQSS